jgi:lysophospholipid acyltransferase (LPLAT)-like uncharacterized protein
MAWLKQLTRAPFVQTAAGIAAAEYLRLVWHTSRFVMEPADIYERMERDLPLIFAFWHGQHFMMPLAKPARFPSKVLISRHRDGEMNAVACARLGVPAIRGSGDHARRYDRKGGVTAFRSMLTALQDNWSMALTADIPKVPRVAGIGIVKLAQLSGRPIYPVAVVTSRRITLANWDRTAINLPFSSGAIVASPPIRVAAGIDADELERARLMVETSLNDASDRAHTITDRRSREHG